MYFHKQHSEIGRDSKWITILYIKGKLIISDLSISQIFIKFEIIHSFSEKPLSQRIMQQQYIKNSLKSATFKNLLLWGACVAKHLFNRLGHIK